MGKFKRVAYEEMDTITQALALPGPFWKDDVFGLPDETEPVQGAEKVLALQQEFSERAAEARTATSSGYGLFWCPLNPVWPMDSLGKVSQAMVTRQEQVL